MSRIVHISRSLALLAVLVMFGGVAVAPAMAAIITYNFSGTVNFVGNNLTPPTPAPFNTGALNNLTGTMTVDNSDGTSGGVIGTYTIQNINLQIGTYSATFGPGGGLVTIRNGNGGGAGGDRFLVTADVDGPNAGNRAPGAFTINLRGPASGPGNVFTTDALPNPAPSVSSFTNRNIFRLQFGNGNGDNRAVQGFLTSLTAVPLPPAMILFGVGLVALIGLGAGGLRNLRLPQA
ncbi:MAG: hypothetical protein E8D52_15450 [Nitrospira sp.]|nr:MAG: hypothetical protein E8D52_15450 [Nitrospira sp.]